MNRSEMNEVEMQQRVETMMRWLANKLETSSREVALDYFQEELYYALRETYLTGRMDSTMDNLVPTFSK
jgi:hypothetical protein